MEIFLNNEEVKKALHVNVNTDWQTCSKSVSHKYKKDPNGSFYLYPELLESNLNILFFNGDTDRVVPFTEA